MKKCVWLSSVLLLLCAFGILSINTPNTLVSDPIQKERFLPKSNAYNSSLLEQNIITSLGYDLNNPVCLGYKNSYNHNYEFKSLSNPELDDNYNYHYDDVGVVNNVQIHSSEDNSTIIEVDSYYSYASPLDFEDPDFWEYWYSSTEKKNATYENLFASTLIIPADLSVSDIQQNNSALLELRAQSPPIDYASLAYFYDLVDDTWLQNDFFCSLKNNSDLAGLYNASWILHGNSTSGFDISIKISLEHSIAFNDQHIYTNESWNYYFNATVTNLSTFEKETIFLDVGRGNSTLVHKGRVLFSVPHETTTYTETEYKYDDYEDYEFENFNFGFNFIAIFVLAFLFIILFIFVIVGILSRNKNRNSFQRHPRQHVEVSYSSQNSPIGRMDTPPPLQQTQPWESLNPNGYRGRMNTPPATPPQRFCPNCGNSFTPQMIHLYQDKMTVFCQFCGEHLDPFFT